MTTVDRIRFTILDYAYGAYVSSCEGMYCLDKKSDVCRDSPDEIGCSIHGFLDYRFVIKNLRGLNLPYTTEFGSDTWLGVAVHMSSGYWLYQTRIGWNSQTRIGWNRTYPTLKVTRILGF